MAHRILLDQNDEDLIKLLNSSSVAYKRAKSKEFIFTYTLMFLALAYPISYIFIKDEGVKQSLFAVSFLVTVSTWFLTDYFKGNTTKGAILKEEFDVRLFKLPWKFLLQKIDPVEIRELSEEYKGKPIHNWYPANISSSIPDSIAIAICQRISSAWDIKLRKKFDNLLQILLFVYTLFVIFLWAIKSVDGRTVFLMYFSILSFYTHILTLKRGNLAAIKKRTSVLGIIDNYIINKKEFAIENLRDIQDELYHVRQEPAKVPDFISTLYNFKIQKYFEAYVDDLNKLYTS